jgi:hypothetical protein
MADERDPKVSQRYRELGADEPPRALDEAILAASRRAVDSHPAPLVAPAGRRRWYFPVAAAAVITLAVAVTVQVERQKPGDEFVVATAPAPAQKQEQPVAPKEQMDQQAFRPEESAAVEARKAAPNTPRALPQFTPEPPPATPAPQASADSLRELAKSTDPATARGDVRSRESVTTGVRGLDPRGLDELTIPGAPAREAAPATAPELVRGAPDSRVRVQSQRKAEQPAAQAAETRRMEAELQVKPAPSAPAPVVMGAPAPQAKPAPDLNVGAATAGMMASRIVVRPEQLLEQIAELRKQGKHEEADKALAEFRKQYPDYRLTDEMRAKVEKK